MSLVASTSAGVRVVAHPSDNYSALFLAEIESQRQIDKTTEAFQQFQQRLQGIFKVAGDKTLLLKKELIVLESAQKQADFVDQANLNASAKLLDALKKEQEALLKQISDVEAANKVLQNENAQYSSSIGTLNHKISIANGIAEARVYEVFFGRADIGNIK